MFHNYITTAVRNLAGHKLYSFINIAGLAVGLAACILILLFVRDELSYDSWLADGDRIYRMEATFVIPGRGSLPGVKTPGPAKAALEKDFPREIEAVTRIYRRRPTIDLGDRQFNDVVAEVDPNFFEVFDLPFVAGDRDTALDDNTSLILSETMAAKYFGDGPALGQTLTLTRETPEVYRVAGVFKDIPENSHLDIDMISRFDPAHYADKLWVTERWMSSNVYTYVKFRSAADAELVSARMKTFVDSNVNFQLPGLENITPSDVLTLNLNPLPKIHLYTESNDGMKPRGDIVTVYTFSAVAVLLLLIASINFMNLSTARATMRAREVSLRKVMGARRGQLVLQFLGESVIMTLAALVLALAITEYALPHYNAFIGKHITLGYLSDPGLIGWLVGLAVSVGLIGGLYPAFVLSGFRPARVLKANQSSSAGGSAGLRAALVVVQFSISIGLIIATEIVFSQTYFAKHMDMGFNKDHMMVVPGIGRDSVEPLQKTLRQEIAKLPGVISVGRASDAPPQRNDSNTPVDLPDAPSDELMLIEVMTVDDDLFPTIGVAPLAGRLFSPDFLADVMPRNPGDIEGEVRAGAILNLRAVNRLGYASPRAAIGQTFRALVGENKKAEVTVVGVIPDLHFRSVNEKITPMIYFLGDQVQDFDFLLVHVSAENLAATLRDIDRVWNDLAPEVPIYRSFVDEDFNNLYRAEEERMKMFGGFALLAVIIACLGLFGLASFAAEHRTKEIGIRKVMGASSVAIVKLLVWQFSRPVLIANVIAWPVAFYFMQGWLENFEYRTDLTLLPFAAAGVLALVIAWTTVGTHAARVARSNPISILRYE